MTRSDTEIRAALARAACEKAAAEGVPADAEAARRFTAALLDRVPDARLPVRVLAQALGDGLAREIARDIGDLGLLEARLSQRLETDHGYRADLSTWAVATIAAMARGEPAPRAEAPPAAPFRVPPSAATPSDATTPATGPWGAASAPPEVAGSPSADAPIGRPAGRVGGSLRRLAAAVLVGVVGGFAVLVWRALLFDLRRTALGEILPPLLVGVYFMPAVFTAVATRDAVATVITTAIVALLVTVADMGYVANGGATLAGGIAAAAFVALRRPPRGPVRSGVEIALVVAVVSFLFLLLATDALRGVRFGDESFAMIVGLRLASAAIFGALAGLLAAPLRRRLFGGAAGSAGHPEKDDPR
jgi:hypothetical protein